MSQQNVELVRAAYAAFSKGDIPAVTASMSSSIVWNEAENHPYADHSPYTGPDAIVKGVFMRLGGEWEGFTVKVDEMFDAGDVVFVRGRESGMYKGTGKKTDAQFLHMFRVKDGKIASFDQYTDTYQTMHATKA